MALANLGLVGKIIKNLAGRRPDVSLMPYDDAFSEGFLGLMRAAELYEEGHGAAFSTYACNWIMQSLIRAAETWTIIHVPVYVVRESKVSPEAELLLQKAQRIRLFGQAGTMDERENTDAEPYENTIAERDACEPCCPDELDKVWAAAPRILDARKLRVLVMIYRDGAILDDVAAELGVSRERVRQLRNQALARLRRGLGIEPEQHKDTSKYNPWRQCGRCGVYFRRPSSADPLCSKCGRREHRVAERAKVC